MNLAQKMKKRLQLEAWNLYKKIQASQHELCYLFWEATQACDLSCKHCGSDCSKQIDTTNELSTAEIVNFFTQLARDFDPTKIMVAITGGDPLCRPDFFEVTAKIYELGFPWGFVSNGHRVTPEIVEKCRQTGMRTTCLSLDGLAAEHSWLRGAENYRRVIEAITLFKAANFLKVIQISSVIHHRNIATLEEMYRLVKSLGVDEWRLIQVAPIGRAHDNLNLQLTAQEYLRLYQFIQTMRQQDKDLRIILCEEGYLGLAWEREVRDSFYDCSAGVRVGGILANGDITACPSLPRDFVQGNIRRDAFKDIWDTRFTMFRDRAWMEQGRCKNCPEFRICQGNSLHLWDFTKNEPKLCHYQLLRNAQSDEK
jgi:radical SAM protein with 4Fe4S-binding SPASM domain